MRPWMRPIWAWPIRSRIWPNFLNSISILVLCSSRTVLLAWWGLTNISAPFSVTHAYTVAAVRIFRSGGSRGGVCESGISRGCESGGSGDKSGAFGGGESGASSDGASKHCTTQISMGAAIHSFYCCSMVMQAIEQSSPPEVRILPPLSSPLCNLSVTVSHFQMSFASWTRLLRFRTVLPLVLELLKR